MRVLCFLAAGLGALGFGCAAAARGQGVPEKGRAVKDEFKRLAGT